MCGAPWGPDEWNLSVGSRYTEHHRGSLSLQKNQQSRSHEVLFWSHTHTQEHARTQAHVLTPATNKIAKRKTNKTINACMHTKWQSSKRHFHFDMQKQKCNWALFWTNRTHTLSLSFQTLSQSKKRKSFQKIRDKKTDKSLNYLIPT